MNCIVFMYTKARKNLYAICWFLTGEAIMEFLVIVVMLVVLDLAAMRWGAISLDGLDSPEWERRQRWYGFH